MYVPPVTLSDDAWYPIEGLEEHSTNKQVEVINTMMAPSSLSGVAEFDVLARARPGLTVKLGPNDQICQIRRITADDVLAVEDFRRAYISRHRL